MGTRTKERIAASRRPPAARCGTCGAPAFVTDSRGDASGTYVRRRRTCAAGHRATTYEVIPRDEEVIVVRRRAGRTEITRFQGDADLELVLARPLAPTYVSPHHEAVWAVEEDE